MTRFSAFFFALMALGILVPASAQTVFDCPSGFSTSGVCGLDVWYEQSTPFAFPNASNSSSLSGSNAVLIPVGSDGGGHSAGAVIYQTAVNIQAFTATFMFVPNGKNIAFVAENNSSPDGGGMANTPSNFSAGAGCEAGFYQAFYTTAPVNNIFALELDQFSPLSSSAPWPYTFSYSSAQIYGASESPCIPPYINDPTPSKISSSPVPLNSPAGTGLTTTGDTYSVTITYDGSNVTVNLYDVTAGGSCPGASCFTNTWTGVNIPSMVGGANTAYVGITGGTNSDAAADLVLKSFSYSAGSTTSTPPTTVSTPTFTPPAGTYTSAQSVTISDATSGATIYYTTNGTTPTTSSQPIPARLRSARRRP